MNNNPNVYVYAGDPIIGRRVVHVVKGGYAISLVTGHKFKYIHNEKTNTRYKIRLKDGKPR